MNRKYTVMFLTFVSSYYLYENYIKKYKIDKSSQTDNEGKNKDKEINKKQTKPLIPIKKLARKGGIVDTVLNLEMISPGLESDIVLRIEEKENEYIIPDLEHEIEISE